MVFSSLSSYSKRQSYHKSLNCYDVAAKHNGKCLDDAVLPGPKLQTELIDIIYRFRRGPVALSADISQMFLQVGLRIRLKKMKTSTFPVYETVSEQSQQQSSPKTYVLKGKLPKKAAKLQPKPLPFVNCNET